jgi:hypothetical protein
MALRQRSWKTKPFRGIIFLSSLIFSLIFAAASKNRPKYKKDVIDSHERYHDALTIIKVTCFLAVAPAIILFIHSVVHDPDTPIVLRGLWALAKQRTLRNLAKKPSDENCNSLTKIQ